MTTIGSYGISALAARRADQSFRSLKGTLTDLQSQLTTGKVATGYAGLGTAAATSLSGRARIATLDGYAANIKDASLRVQLMAQGVTQLDKLSGALRTSLPSSATSGLSLGLSNAQASADAGLKQAIDIFNTEVGGRHLFAGRAADVEPVVPYDLMINGDAGRAGLKTLIAERKAADLGSDGRGRLTLASAGTNVTLSEASAGLPFGFKILSASSSSGAITATQNPGPPASAGFAVASQPVAGDTISLVLGLPDGSQTTLTLGAGSGGDATFTIGATTAATAANLATALDGVIQSQAKTTLASASAMAASTAFFAGSPSSPPSRVPGPPYETATALVPGTAADTVIWYQGDDAAGSARETAPVRIGDGQSVAIGARANEPAFQALLASLGALAAETFPETDPTSHARYVALSERVSGSLNDDATVRNAASDLSLARVALNDAANRVAAGKNQYQDLLDGAENADPNEVAMKLLATQTRLQASYQTTSVLARLTLVDFI